MKIFPKTFLYTLALLTLIALLANGLIYTLMPTVYTNHKQQSIILKADELATRLESANRQDIVGLMGSFATLGQTNIIINVGQDTYSLIVWHNGAEADGPATTTVSITSEMMGQETELPGETPQEHGDSLITKGEVSPLDVDNFYSPAQTIHAQRTFTMEDESGTLTLSMTLAPVEEAVGVIVSLLPISIFLCIVIAVLFSLLYARAITRPIKAISLETRRMTLLNRSAHCQIRTKDEFGELAANVNELYQNLLSTIDSLETELQKVTAGERAKTDFLRAASHELKTPATAISVIMDNMILGIGKYKDYDQWLPKCKTLVDSLSGKLCDILAASDLEQRIEPCVTKSLEAFCAQVLDPYLIIARARGLSLYIDWSASFEVTAPPQMLEKALSNIFSNAAQYTAPGKRLSIYCKGRKLIVENECTPIPLAQLERLYEPFYRPDASRSRETGGNGLGLYIVKTNLDHMKVDYRFEQMKDPEGMRFVIYF